MNQVEQVNEHKFPYFQLFILSLCRIAEPIALTSIFPYAYPMVRGFVGEDNPNNALYTGVLISSFSFAEALTGMFWGGLSDRIGRKPVLLLGLFGTMLSLLMIGFATSFAWALCARMIGGLLNGNMGVIQTMVGEFVKNPDHEPRAFAIMPFVWCIGSILGPAMAGMTSNSKLFPDHAYLLPNLIGAGFLLFSVGIGFCFLEETLAQECTITADEKEPLLKVSHTSNQDRQELQGMESYGTVSWLSGDEEELQPVHNTLMSKSCPERVFNKKVLILMSTLCIYCYHSMAYDHLLPVFLQDDRFKGAIRAAHNPFEVSGGLGLSTQDVGAIMAVNGVIALLVQGLIFPLMTDYLGVWHTFVLAMVLQPLASIVVPYTVLLPQNLIFPGIYVCLGLRNLFYIPAYPLLIILIKEASDPKHMGKINGLAASAGAVARMFGPPIAGLFYGLGTQIGFSGLAWFATGLVAIGGAAQIFWIERDKSCLVGVKVVREASKVDGKSAISVTITEVEP